MNRYTRTSSEEYVLEINLEYPKELPELQNDCPLSSDKIEIKWEVWLCINLRLLIYTIFLLVMLKN